MSTILFQFIFFHMVAWHMIVRMTIRMVPDDRNIQKSERSVIAPPLPAYPRTIIRSQIQAIFLDIVFSTNRQTQDALPYRNKRHASAWTRLYYGQSCRNSDTPSPYPSPRMSARNIWSLTKPFLFTIPEGENNGSLRLNPVAKNALATCRTAETPEALSSAPL